MRKIRLIIVEDEPAILNGITRLVKKLDELPLEIAGTYGSGEDALRDLKTARPDIVMTDVQMPVMSGLELIDAIKQKGYEAEYLILSGYAEFEYVQKALKLSVSNYLLKSPRLSELKEALSAVCDKVRNTWYARKRQFFQNLIFQQYVDPEEMEISSARVYLCLLGPYLEGSHGELKLNAEEWSSKKIREYLQNATKKDCWDIWIFGGHYPNMKVMVVLDEEEEHLMPEMLYRLVEQQAEPTGLSLTMAASEKTKELAKLPNLADGCLRHLKKRILFGKNQLIFCKEDTVQIQDVLSKEDQDMLYQALSTTRADLMVKQYRYFGEKWKQNSNSQAECTAMTESIIREICRQILKTNHIDIEPDALKKAGSNAVRAQSLETYLSQNCSLIEELYTSFVSLSADNQIGQVVELLWDYLKTNYSSDPDVNGFARNYGYHPVYLITQFSKLKGISPTKLIIQLRIERAKKLLKSSEMSLKEIAENVGYGDVSYFSRSFKEHEGISPSAYRKM